MTQTKAGRPKIDPVERIKAARLTFEVSQDELSSRLGITRQAFSQVENGGIEVTSEWADRVVEACKEIAAERTTGPGSIGGNTQSEEPIP